jgi:hypothetical protein
MRKKSLFVLIAAAVLSSCSKNEVEMPLTDETGEIVLRSSVINVNSASTRTAYEGTDLAANPLTALVLTSLTSQDYSSPYCTGTMTFSGTNAAKYNKPMWTGNCNFDDYGNTPNKDHFLTGLYPVEGWTVESGVYTQVLSGKEDVMLAEEVNTNYTAVKGKIYKTLDFKHHLTLLKLKFTKQDVSGFNITVKDVKVINALGGLNTKALAKVSGSSQDVTFEHAATRTELDTYIYPTDQTLSAATDISVPATAATPQAYVLVPPVTATNTDNEYTFRIFYTDEDGKDTYLDVYADLVTNVGGTASLEGLSKNLANTITFNFVDGNIKVQAGVAGWNDEGSKDYDI